MTRRAYSIWLGCYASAWAHRGYRVCGDRVEGVQSMRDARRIVRESLGRYVSMTTADGTYCYRTRAEMDLDDSGTGAVAVIDRGAEPGRIER